MSALDAYELAVLAQLAAEDAAAASPGPDAADVWVSDYADNLCDAYDSDDDRREPQWP
jgi:hypothetical protein